MKGHPVPLYRQIEHALRSRIKASGLLPGDNLGSEAELCRQFNVSKIVVRQALQNLENAGLVVRIQGKGTYVGDYTKGQTLKFFSPWFDDLVQENIDYTHRLVSKECVEAPAHIARIFQTPAGGKVYRFEAVRTLDDGPVLYLIVHVPLSIGAEIADHVGPKVTYVGLIERTLGIQIVELRQEITAQAASAHIAAILEVEPGAPTLFLQRIYLSREGPAVVSESYARPDRYRYSVSITR